MPSWAYAQYNNGVGDKIAQHIEDREDSPWNYGYLHPGNTVDRARFAAGVVHVL